MEVVLCMVKDTAFLFQVRLRKLDLTQRRGNAAAWERSGSARDNTRSDLTPAAHCKQASEHKNAKQQSNAIMRALLSTITVELGCGGLSVANWQR